MARTVGDVVARYFAEKPGEDKLESWITAVMEPLIPTATGELRFFEVEHESFGADGREILSLRPPHGKVCNREVFALAERVLWSCSESEEGSLEAVAKAIRAGRIAFMRARLASAIFHARPIYDGESEPEYLAAVKRWQTQALSVLLDDIDRVALESLLEPDFMIPQGYAFAIVFSHRDATMAAIEAVGTKRAAGGNTLKQCLAGAALAWLDGAMLATDGQTALTLVAAAGHALDMAQELSAPKNARASLAGLQGSEVKHAATRALKAWALSEAKTCRGDDMSVARKLSRRIPSDLAGASVDPARLIYDAIREAKRQTRIATG